MPPAAPTVPSPATAAAAYRRPDRHAHAERNDGGSDHGARTVARRIVGNAVNHGWVIDGYVYHLRAGRLDHDDLLALLGLGLHGLLRRRLEVPCCLDRKSTRLNSSHLGI